MKKTDKNVSESGETSKNLWLLDHVLECPSCGLVQEYSPLQKGELIACHRCGRELSRHPVTSHQAVPFAFAIASAILYLMMICFPLLSIDIYGRENSLGVLNSSMEFMDQGWEMVGILVGLVAALFPLVAIVLILLILWGSRQPKLPRQFAAFLHAYRVLRPWSMIEVYILGIFVAYTKLSNMAYVKLDYALYAIIALMISMSITDASIDFAALWKRCRICAKVKGKNGIFRIQPYSERHLPDYQHLISCEACHLVFATDHPVADEEIVADCPRCQNRLHKRKVNSLNRSLAFLVAAFIFYIPANLYPIMTMTMMGKESDHRIFQGVIELWQSHMVPLALLVFFASITVPVMKIAGIATMIGVSLFGSKRYLVLRSRLFQLICFVGRWSMIDVFMISILIALIKFNALATIRADFGIVTFAAVVILTIFAADAFDPRLMWDYAGMNRTDHAGDFSAKENRKSSENRICSEKSC